MAQLAKGRRARSGRGASTIGICSNCVHRPCHAPPVAGSSRQIRPASPSMRSDGQLPGRLEPRAAGADRPAMTELHDPAVVADAHVLEEALPQQPRAQVLEACGLQRCTRSRRRACRRARSQHDDRHALELRPSPAPAIGRPLLQRADHARVPLQHEAHAPSGDLDVPGPLQAGGAMADGPVAEELHRAPVEPDPLVLEVPLRHDALVCGTLVGRPRRRGAQVPVPAPPELV